MTGSIASASSSTALLAAAELAERLDLELTREPREDTLLAVVAREAPGALPATADELLRRSRLPVLVVPEELDVDTWLDRADPAVLCGVDAAAHNHEVADFASLLADALDARLVFADATRRSLSQAAIEEGAAFTVVDTRGRGPLLRFVLGSLSASLASESPLPVLVIPEGTALDARSRAGERARAARLLPR